MRHRRTLTLLAGLAVAAVLAVPRPALADYHSQKTLKLEPGGRFVIDLAVGSVTLTGTTESGAKIEITSNHDDFEQLFNLDFQESAGEARVTVRKKYDFHWPNRLWAHFDVRVPADTQVDVKTSGGSVEISRMHRDADLNTSGGSIKVSDFSANLRAHTSGGTIALREVSGNAKVDTSGGSIEGDALSGTLDARTSGGSIRLDKVRGDLLAHTSGGSIRIDDAGGKVDARTSGGSVDVAFGKGNARGGELSTSGGGIRVAVDPSVNLDLEADTSSGRVVSDVPITTSGTLSSSHLHGKIGSGGETLRVHADGGPIHIEAR
jgi:putative adhesin